EVRQYFAETTGSYYITRVETGGPELLIQSDGDLILQQNNGRNVGIGTDTPLGKFQVGAGGVSTVIDGWGSGSDIDALLAGSVSGSLLKGAENAHMTFALRDNDDADSFNFLSTGANYGTDNTYDKLIMVMRSDGKVGIGVASPSFKLDVSANTTSQAASFYNASSTGDGIGIRINATTPSTEAYYMVFRDGGNGIDGTIRANGSGGVTFNTTSDERLKENIVDTKYGLDDLMNVKVRDYNFIGNDSDRTGFIAQQLYEVFPNAVTPGGEDEQLDPWTVDYSRVTPLLVAGVQDMNEVVQEQKREIASLNVKNDKMEKENKEMKIFLCSKYPEAPFCE
ncbi:MAG: tail fiber domain-containing protein, partial [Thiotrichaceae bacterium]|nr:tail fiber domain-containing protein [Thiotrichaceae bacterium]